VAGQQQGAQPAGEGAKPGGEENRPKEEVKPAKFKYGNTQAVIPEDSDAYRAILALQKKVADADLAGKGKDVDEPHVTVRYGIQGNDLAGIRKYLESQAPFEAKLGVTGLFPPTENSDGAAVIMVPIESADLHRMNAEIEKHGDFKESDFKEYKPHATIAYVKPEEAEKYKGLTDAEGKTFRITSVDISDRDGNKETVELKGKPASNTPKARFQEVYERTLRAAHKQFPERYKWPIEQVPAVAQRMAEAMAKGTANMDSPAIKAALRELGVKQTRKAANEFFAKAEVPPASPLSHRGAVLPNVETPAKPAFSATARAKVEKPEAKAAPPTSSKPTATMSEAELRAELAEIDKFTHPLYQQLEKMGDAAFAPNSKTGAYTPDAQTVSDQIKPYARRAEFLRTEIKEHERKAQNEKNWTATAKRIADAPVYQRRNGWEIIRDGGNYVLRDPETREEVYTGHLDRARAVADESKPGPEGAIEQHRAAHTPGTFAQLVINHGKAADKLVALLKDPKADPKDLADAAAKVDEYAPAMEQETGNRGGPVWAEDFGYKKPAAVEPKVGDTVTVYLGGRDWPNTRVENVANGKYGVDVMGFKYVDRSDITTVTPRKLKAPVIDEAYEKEKTRKVYDQIAEQDERHAKEAASKPYPARPGGETEAEFDKRLAGREPYQITKGDWSIKTAYDYIAGGERRDTLLSKHMGSDAGRREYHEKAVKDALAAGKTVPPEVLADYPELGPKLQAAPEEPKLIAPKPKPLPPNATPQEAYDHAVEAYKQRTPADDQNGYNIVLNGLAAVLEQKGMDPPADYAQRSKETGASPFLWELSALFHSPLAGAKGTESPAELGKQMDYMVKPSNGMPDYALSASYGRDTHWRFDDKYTAQSMRDYYEGNFNKDISGVEQSANMLRRKAEIVKALIGETANTKAAEERAATLDNKVAEERSYAQGQIAKAEAKEAAEKAVQDRAPITRAEHMQPLDAIRTKPKQAWGEDKARFMKGKTWISDGHVALNRKGAAGKFGQKALDKLMPPDDGQEINATVDQIYSSEKEQPLELLGALSSADADEKTDMAFFLTPKDAPVAVSAHKLRLIQNIYGKDGLTYRGKGGKNSIAVMKGGKIVAILMPFQMDPDKLDVPTAKKTMAAGGYKESVATPAEEPKKPSSAADLDATMSAFGFANPAVFARLFPDVAQRMVDWVADEPTDKSEQKAMMRQTRGEMDRRVAIAVYKLKDEAKRWTSRSHAESIRFWNAVESGDLSRLAPSDRTLANLFKAAFDSMREELQALKPEVLQNYIENYFPHLWERQSSVAASIKGLLTGKRPFAGSGAFLKKRSIPTMQDGLDLGFQPKTWNPVESFLMKYAEMAQFLMAHQTLEVMKNSGTAKFVRISQKAPDGWKQLDDRIGTVYRRVKALDENKLEDVTQPLTYPGGKRKIPGAFSEDIDEAMHGEIALVGHYYAPADAAKVFNNYVSRGIAGKSSIYDTARWINDNMNALQLGISAFHATTISVVGAASDVALGLQQLSEGKPVRAGMSLARVVALPVSIFNTVRNGSRLMREYLQPGSYAKLAREAAAVAIAGGRAKMATVEISPIHKAINAFRNGAIAKGLSLAPGAVLRGLTAPIMDYYVPRMKFGIFYGMAHDIIDEASKENLSGEEMRRRLDKAWDSVDNRAGQMVYENLFWNKAVRDLAQVATRSVGWNYGSYREAFEASKGLARGVGNVLRGKKPTLTPALAFALALPLTVGYIGAGMNYLRTGHGPENWKDYFYLKNADGTYLNIPGYMKDVFAFGHNPLMTVANKMGPLLESTSELLQNKDFYGTEIRHTDDPIMQQLGEVAEWAGKQLIPFSFSGAGKLLEQRGAEDNLGSMIEEAVKHLGDLGLGQLGFQKAPSYIQNSPAMNMARDYERENRPPGTKTAEQDRHYKAMDAIVRMYREHEVDQKQIDRYIEEGIISRDDPHAARDQAKQSPMARAAENLSITQVLNVWQAATPEERKELRPILRDKEYMIHDERSLARRQQLRDAYKVAMSAPVEPVTFAPGVI
jgi:2'-5' RNA ligase